ncbi:MAG TPA: aspartyl protease family protein [Nitrospirota bacterium]|nr:aspartyl protease family protein [Nitrospirota bacterium]
MFFCAKCICFAAAAFLLVGGPSPCRAADYYKWMDEHGNLHFSDSLQNIPEKYRKQIEKKEFLDDASPDSESVPAPKVISASDAGKQQNKPLKRFEVPYKPSEGSAKRVIVDVVLNNSVRAAMAIDTGAPETVISARLAEKIGLFNEDQERLVIRTGGIGGSAPAIRSIVNTIQVGEGKSEFVPIIVISALSKAFEGLLGLDFVSNFSMTIDAKREILIFEEIPLTPDKPGGHDREWWTSHFAEFAESRARWKAYSESLGQSIHDSMQSTANEDVKRKAFADVQLQEAEKMLDKLNRYASRHSVPIEWRQY